MYFFSVEFLATAGTPVVIVYFLGGLGALLGPLFGIIMVDYWLIRRSSVNVPQLYVDTHDGEYFYRRGVNPRAIGAFVPAALASLAVALLPVFHGASEFSWFIGAGLGALCYLVIAKREPEYTDQHGEAIAVATTH